MMRVYLIAVAFALILNAASNGSKILGLFPYSGKSHFIMYEQLMLGLANRGHEVTVYSHFPQKKPVKNYLDKSLEGSMMAVVNNVNLDEDFGNNRIHVTLGMIAFLGNEMCENVLASTPIQELLKSTESYDLIITETFVSDCFLGFVHKFKVPHIQMFSSATMPWTNDRLGNPDNPSYIPNHFAASGSSMSFGERFLNTVYYLVTRAGYYWLCDRSTEAMARKHFGSDMPPLQDIARNVSLYFVNSHVAIQQARPTVPAFVEVGGMHLQPPNSLPQDLLKIIDGAKNGVIFFTLGSTVRVHSLPEQKRQALLDAFAELPYTVIWKWEESTLPNQPKNVHIAKWLPQADLLAHPKVRAFITHGGLMGTQEAIYHGVPMIMIPLFGDQDNTVASLVEKGAAVRLSFHSITKETVLHAVKTVVDNPSYKETAVYLSRVFRDAPLSPVNTAIYWTEYVLRHNGAPHLRSAATSLTWYQYLLLDILAAVLVVIFILLFLIKHALRKLFGSSPAPAKRKVKSN